MLFPTRLLWSHSLRRQLSEIEEKIRSDFTLQDIELARQEAKSENQRISKIVELWKGASVDKFFVAWLKVTRRTKRQNMCILRISCEPSYGDIPITEINDVQVSPSVTETKNFTTSTSSCSSNDQRSLAVIDVKQEIISAAFRVLQAKKG